MKRFLLRLVRLSAALCGGWTILTAAENPLPITMMPGAGEVAVRPCDERKSRAQAGATVWLGAYLNLKLIMAICSPAVPGVADAGKQAGKTGQVKGIGLGLPSENRRHGDGGVTDCVVLRPTAALGYLAVQAGFALAKSTRKAAGNSIHPGSLGMVAISGDNMVQDKLFVFTRDNIDGLNFQYGARVPLRHPVTMRAWI